MAKLKLKYFLDSDDDGHWYVVNVKYRSDWEDWKSQGTDVPLANFQTPHYAVEIDNPAYIVFGEYEDLS